MWKPISFLLMSMLILSAPIALAAEAPLNQYVHLDNLNVSALSPQLKIALASESNTSDSAKNNSSHRDCSALTYEITLFKPCEGEDAAQLWSRTKILAVGAIGVAGFIALLPEDISKWDRSEIGKGQLLEKWWENVKGGPVWDNDKWYINYIGHPYFGSVYYQSARKSGYNQWNSMYYSFLMSTFYWEYGLEAFAETPSMQDLVVTPLGGWIYGEWSYHTEQKIRANGGVALGSKTWGAISLFLLDPVGHIGKWFGNKKVKLTSFNITHQPPIKNWNTSEPADDYWGVNFAISF